MKSWMVFLALAVTTPSAAAPREATPAPLRVVTLNLWHDQSDWPKRLAVILAGLRERKPDVLCLQEVLQHTTLRNQAETLADSLGFQAHFVSVDGVEREKRYGNAILTPHRVIVRGGKNLAPANDYRVVAHLRVDVRGHVVNVYDTHLHHTPEGGAIRATQVADLLAFVDSTRGDGAVVLAGDFNAVVESPELSPVLAAWQDVYGATRKPGGPANESTMNAARGLPAERIDHVFVPAGSGAVLKPLAARVLFQEPGPGGVWASDHFGVYAELGWGGARRGAKRGAPR